MTGPGPGRESFRPPAWPWRWPWPWRSAAAVVVSLAHPWLLLAPGLFLGEGWWPLTDPALVAFLVGLGLLTLGEAFATLQGGRVVDKDDDENRRHHRLAAWTGATLFAIFLVGVVERISQLRSLERDPTGAMGWFLAWRAVGPVTRLLGLSLFALGGGLRIVAARTLGARFGNRASVLPGQELCRSGPFRLVRHPSELGLLLVALGATMLLGSPSAALLVALVLLPLILVRIGREESQLASAFFPAYADYSRRVRRLIPFVY